MAAQHYLQVRALGAYPRYDVTPERFASISNARNTLLAILSLEEVYEVLLSNYRTIEQLLANYSVMTMLRPASNHDEFFEMRVRFNTAIVNLLTAARLYVDRVPSLTADSCPTLSDSNQSIKTRRSAEYDAYKEYRFMEALRNYVQHYALPIYTVGFGSTNLEGAEYHGLEHYVDVRASKSILMSTDFKKAALADFTESIDLIAAIRVYVECLGRIQEFARGLSKVDVDQSRNTINAAIEDYRSVYPSLQAGLHLFSEQEEELNQIPILIEWDDVRLRLQENNAFHPRLLERFASTRTR